MDEYFDEILSRNRLISIGLNGDGVDFLQPNKNRYELPLLSKSQMTFMHLRSTGAEQTILIKCRDYDLWSWRTEEENVSNDVKVKLSTITLYNTPLYGL